MLSSLTEVLLPVTVAGWIYTFLWYTSLMLFAFGVYWYGFGRFRVIEKLGIPGPKPTPFIAHIGDIVRTKFQFHILLDEYRSKYGDCFGLYLNGQPTVVVSDPEVIKQVLVKDFGKFHDREAFAELPEPLDSFMTIVKGERWKFIRNTLTPSFTSGKMRPMSSLMNEVTDTLVKKCKLAAEEGKPVDFLNFQQTLTLEAILGSAFGTQAHSQSDPNDPVTKMARKAMSNPKWISFVSLLPGSSKFFKYLPYGFSYLMAPIMGVTRQIVNQRRAAGYHADTKDLLQLMLDAQDEPDKEGRRLTDNEVIAQALVFLLAGHETSSTTLTLTCYNLATNQDAQEKLYQEIIERIPNDDQHPDYDMVQNFEYLDMVISETLRLYPPGSILLRTCNEDCTIKGIPFKTGLNVMVPVYSIHRDEKYWKEPTKYHPERFCSEAKAARDPFTFLPFGHGPRNCIGMRFAQLEMKIVLARLIKEFRLEISEETEIPPNIVQRGTLTVNGPVYLKVTPRK